jgi:glucose-6-phosphate 1-dehydrogenase
MTGLAVSQALHASSGFEGSTKKINQPEEYMQNHKRPPASLIFIFGGSGDLNFRKLAPALFNLFIDDWMPEKFGIVGIGRSVYSDEKYRARLWEGIQQFSRRKQADSGQWEKFASQVSYLQMDAENETEYPKIAAIVSEHELKNWAP